MACLHFQFSIENFLFHQRRFICTPPEQDVQVTFGIFDVHAQRWKAAFKFDQAFFCLNQLNVWNLAKHMTHLHRGDGNWQRRALEKQVLIAVLHWLDIKEVWLGSENKLGLGISKLFVHWVDPLLLQALDRACLGLQMDF